MSRTLTVFIGAVGILLIVQRPSAQQTGPRWTDFFKVTASDWTSTGRNAYFVLEPGYSLVLEGNTGRLTVTVTTETRRVDGVETRVVEERETNKGELVEVSRNFFAMSKSTSSAFYFGEEVDEYRNGKLVGHAGAWLSGENGARFGLMMPGLPLAGSRYYQEVAPRVAMDRAEIVSVTDTLKTPAGDFADVVCTLETTPLEPKLREYKYYARGVGLIQDGRLKLVKFGKP